MVVWADCPLKCGFSTTAQGKRRGENHAEICLWEGSFQLDATGTLTRAPVLAALRRQSLMRAWGSLPPTEAVAQEDCLEADANDL